MNSEDEEAPNSTADMKMNPKKMNRNMTVVPGKRVQIMTPEQETSTPISPGAAKAKRSQTVGGKAMKKKVEVE